jgi:hypothetical protein
VTAGRPTPRIRLSAQALLFGELKSAPIA